MFKSVVIEEIVDLVCAIRSLEDTAKDLRHNYTVKTHGMGCKLHSEEFHDVDSLHDSFPAHTDGYLRCIS